MKSGRLRVAPGGADGAPRSPVWPAAPAVWRGSVHRRSSARQGAGREVGAKLSVASMFGMTGKHAGNDSYQQTSRVKFNVHVDLPCVGETE